MTVAEAVRIYVDKRRLDGLVFECSETTLRTLVRQCGDVSLENLSAERLSQFVNNERLSPGSQQAKFSAVTGFIRYWSDRGLMKSLTVIKPLRQVFRPAPYIYTIEQVRLLLSESIECQSRCRSFTGETLRAMILTVYGTGATINEVLALRVSGLHPKRLTITFQASKTRNTRSIPIGADLHAQLMSYRRSTSTPSESNALFFRSIAKGEIGRSRVYIRFNKLCERLQLPRKERHHPPRMLDLRFTFAVHRVTYWIVHKDNLNELMPALSMYMGYSSLIKSEEFLAFAPKRFQSNLDRLSPNKTRKHWRDDPVLLSLLSTI